MTPSALIAEKIRATTETGTNYATAKALGISQSNLKQILDGSRNLGIEACVRAAELLKQPLSEIIAEVEMSRAHSPEKKAFWEKRLPRILPAVAIWGLIAGVNQFTGVVRGEGLTTVSQAIHYAYWRRRLGLRLLARILLPIPGRTAYGLGCFAT